MGRQAAQGIAINSASINVSEQATARQGLSTAMGTSAGNRPGTSARMVMDSSYHIGEMRKKVNDINTELNSLQSKIQSHNTAQAQASGLNRKAEDLDKEVRTLEGTLADYNIAQDKHRQGSDVNDLYNFIAEYESRNKAFAAENDRLLIAKMKEETDTQKVELQIREMHQHNQQKINELEPDKLQMYQNLMERNEALQHQSDQIQKQIDQYSDQCMLIKQAREGNQLNMQFKELEVKGNKLFRQHQSLQEEAEITKLEPKEMLERYIAKMKADKGKIQQVDSFIKEIDDENKRLEASIMEVTQELQRGDGSKKDQYEKLYQRDREMTQLIESFPEEMRTIEEDQDKTRKSIVLLLENISLGMESEQNMPDQETFNEMKQQETFKDRQLENSNATMARLLQEKAQRTQEMEKIQNLDEKIKLELSSLAQKMDAMRAEMGQFDDLDTLRTQAQRSKIYLQDQLESYRKRIQTTKEQVKSVSFAYEQVKKELEGNETAEKLKGLEVKLSNYGQQTFTLQEFVATRGRATDYETLKNNCMSIMSQLNQLAIEAQHRHAQNLSNAPISNAIRY